MSVPRDPSFARSRRRRVASRIAGPCVLLLLGTWVVAQPASSSGTTAASIGIAGVAELVPRVGLRLSAPRVAFDLRDGLGDGDGPACVVGGGADVVTRDAFGTPAVIMPAGTGYRSSAWPDVIVEGGTPLTVFPLPPAADGPGVVCYRSFLLHTFANVDGWQLAAARLLPPGELVQLPIFVAGTCRGEPDAGLQVLEGATPVVLTSDRPAGACSTLLVVIALRADEALAGETIAEIQYTLLSADADFAPDPEVRP